VSLASPQQVGNKLATSQFTGKLRGNVSNGFWAIASWAVLNVSCVGGSAYDDKNKILQLLKRDSHSLNLPITKLNF